MSIPADIISALKNAGVSDAQIVQAIIELSTAAAQKDAARKSAVRSLARERKRKSRESRDVTHVTDVTRDGFPDGFPHPSLTLSSSPPTPPLRGCVVPHGETPDQPVVDLIQVEPVPKPKRQRLTPKTRLRPDFVPDDEWLQFAQGKGFSEAEAGAMWQQFRDHHIAKASAFADWTAAWRTWVRRQIEITDDRNRRTASYQPRAH